MDGPAAADATSDATVRAAAIQMTTGPDPGANRATAERLVRRAASRGAELVVLPEKWPFLHDPAPSRAAAEALDGPSVAAARDWAVELGVAILAGSLVERIPASDQTYNTSVLIRPDGGVAACYRKLHMFDVEVGGRVYRESDGARPGDAVVTARVAGRRVGLSICYDLRFPELYRRLTLEGAEIVVVPAAFTALTGKDHWEPLLRARAIENQVFVVAANQIGRHANGTASHGRSMIVDPWGVILAQAADEETVIVADLEMAALRRIRERLPVLHHRRADVYGDPTGPTGPAAER